MAPEQEDPADMQCRPHSRFSVTPVIDYTDFFTTVNYENNAPLTISIMAFSIMTFSIMIISVITFKHNGNQHNDIQHNDIQAQ